MRRRRKRLTVPRHSYRLCLITGIQPANAGPILDDGAAATPQRFLWMPAEDRDAPNQKPPEPEPWPDPLWTPHSKIDSIHDAECYEYRVMRVCDTATAEIDQARLNQLRGTTTETLDGHALLCQLKVAAALALLDRRGEVNDEDWRLAGMVRAVSDQTRQHVADVLKRDKAETNRARAHAEADRAIVVDNRMAEAATQRVARSINGKLDTAGGWVSHAELRRKAQYKDRGYFDEAIEALKLSGQVEEREVKSGQNGTEYRKVERGVGVLLQHPLPQNSAENVETIFLTCKENQSILRCLLGRQFVGRGVTSTPQHPFWSQLGGPGKQQGTQPKEPPYLGRPRRTKTAKTT